MQWTDEVRIETPEQIDVDLELAGLGSRFVAQFVDWCVKIVVTLALFFIALMIAALMGASVQFEALPKIVIALLIAAVYFLWFGYDVFFEVTRNGQTPGKKYCGIRVIREGGAPLDFTAGCVRNLLALADLLPMFYFLGAVLILLNRRRQRLGDLAAGTIVVRERAVAAPVEVDAAVQRFARPEFAFTATQLANCAKGDRHLLRSFLQRLPELDRASRAQLARKLADQFVQKTGYVLAAPLHEAEDAAAFLASLYRDLEEHARRGY
jgi:uncharacterized RDD family membrane protein YckC